MTTNLSVKRVKQVITFCGFLAIFLAQVFIQYIPGVQSVLLVLFLIGMSLFILLKGKAVQKKLMLFVFPMCVALIALGGLLGYSPDPIKNLPYMYFYFSVMLGFLFANDYSFFVKLIKIFLLINMFAMLYEFLNSSYILEPTSDLEHFIGRAKGLVSYSKEAGAFIMVVTILLVADLHYKWFPVLFISSVLTGSRMAMIFVFIMLLVELFRRTPSINMRKYFSKLPYFLLIIVSLIVFINFYTSLEQSEIIRNRLAGSFDTGHSSNIERIGFWLEHFSIYSNFNAIGLIFGQPSKAQTIAGNGAENAFLNLLTDGGGVAVLLYISAMIFMYVVAKGRFSMFIKLLLLVIAMQVSRVALGFLDGTVFWACFWVLLLHHFSSRNPTPTNHHT